MAEKQMNVQEKLMLVQQELKAPKNQYNSFGKYSYRSCEDILEGVKPLLAKVKATLTLSDEIVQIADRIYVKSTAIFTDAEKPTDVITNAAYAREAADKKGMDESQISGTASSYARKYSLNGLFCIDDTKDADTDENRNERTVKANKQKSNEKTDEEKNAEMIASVDPDLVPNPNRTQEERIAKIKAEMERTGINLKSVLATAGIQSLEEITDAQYVALLGKFKKQKDKVK